MDDSAFELQLTLTDEEFFEQFTELFKTRDVSQSKFEKLTLRVLNSSDSHIVTVEYAMTGLSVEVVR
jgi:hypothetical protein